MNKIFTYIFIFMIVILPVLLVFAWIEKQNQIKRLKNLDELLEKHTNKQIEKLREKFRCDLIGEWVSFEGTFSTMMNETWTFNEDGSGKIIYRSVMFGEDVDDFKWRRKGEFNIEIVYFGEDETDSNWVDVRYDFGEIQTDCGSVISLVEVDEENNLKKGFGISEIPLSYEGSLD